MPGRDSEGEKTKEQKQKQTRATTYNMRRARKATIYIYKWCKTAQIGRQSKDKDNGIKRRRRERGIAIKSNKERGKSHREAHREYRTPLRYITGRKTPRNNSNEAEQNKTKQKQKSHTYLLYNFTNLALELHVGLTKVRASPGAVECFRSPLDPPVPLAHVLRSSHPIPSILDNNSECDPLPSFALARDRAEGLEIFLEAVHPRRRRSTSSLGSLHRQPPKHDSL